jgi:uncharacterized protein (TIGR02145 family)
MRRNFQFIVLMSIGIISGCSSEKLSGVAIDKQIWQTENLSTDKFSNGDDIPEVKTSEEWQSAAEKGEPAWCYYDNDAYNQEKYGKLYNWYAVNDPRGIAPKGWKVPTDEDWQLLCVFLGGDQLAGQKLKSIQGWEGDGNGTDEVGFNAMPGGFRKTTGEFSSIGSFALFWSATQYDDQIATYRYLDAQTQELSRFNYLKGDGLSVRLIKE